MAEPGLTPVAGVAVAGTREIAADAVIADRADAFVTALLCNGKVAGLADCLYPDELTALEALFVALGRTVDGEP